MQNNGYNNNNGRRPVQGRPAGYGQRPVRSPSQMPQGYNRAPAGRRRRKKTLGQKIGSAVLKTLAFLLTFVIIVAATLFISLKMMSSSSYPAAQSVLIPTLLETGQLKFLASWLLPSDEIQEIVDRNSMKKLDGDVDDSLINIGGNSSVDVSGDPAGKEEPITVKKVSGSTFSGTMMIVKDPSRVFVGSIYDEATGWRDEGVTLDKLVDMSSAVGGINGGLYNSYNNSGGAPYGVLVSNGEIQLNEPQQFPGLVLIGMTEDNILQIIDISEMGPIDIITLVQEKHIRDAVTFQEEASDANNHFVQLIINNEAREMSGAGSGLNPRTAIGQRADGAILLFVADGRGASGHLGASASDLINVMLEYGAVNAANLDGGSSSCMYYDGEYLMNSVTFYYANSSWKLPAGFMVK